MVERIPCFAPSGGPTPALSSREGGDVHFYQGTPLLKLPKRKCNTKPALYLYYYYEKQYRIRPF